MTEADKPDTDKLAAVTDISLPEELRQVRNELIRLNALHLFEWNRRTANVLFMQFLKGTFLGLGSLLGATIVISVLVYFLSQIEFIPIIGDWVKQINQILQTPK